MPAYVDTGLNIVHVDDVAAGHLLAFERGRAGERYILGGEDMTLQTMLAQISALVGRTPPRMRLPYARGASRRLPRRRPWRKSPGAAAA